MRRVAGREIECTVLQGAWNFQAWLAPLQIQLSGLTATETGPHVAHCFRIVPRAHLKQYAGHAAWAIEKARLHVIGSLNDLSPRQDVAEGTVAQQQRDAILLCKHEMHSRELCQMPQLLLPAARLDQLKSSEPTEPLQTNEMSQEEIREFRKTARKIEEDPWNLQDGGNYLRGLCDRAENGPAPRPAPLTFYQRCIDLGTPMQACHWKDFAPDAPKRVEVVRRRLEEPEGVLAGKVGEAEEPKAAMEDGKRKREVLAQASVHAQEKRLRLAPPEPKAEPKPKAQPKAEPKPKAQPKAEPKPKAQPKAEPKAKAQPKALAQKAKAEAQPKVEARQYGCSKCYWKNGCKQCENYRPGYPKPWRGKGAGK